MKHKTILLLTTCIFGIALEKSSATPPTFLLTIDDSNPSAVIFTTTGLNPVVDDTGRTANSGIDLLNFFNQSEAGFLHELLPNSSLKGGNMTLSYDSVISDGAGNLDLGLYVSGSTPGATQPETFSTTQPAFTGSWTINLSSLGLSASVLPAIGSQGQIQSGYSGDPGNIIGSWQVVTTVPEPSSASLLLLGSGVGFVVWRRRNCKKDAARA